MKHKAAAKHKKHDMFIDGVIYVAAFVEPLFVLPQIIQIFRLHDATSVSLVTWIGFNVLTAIWVWWAILKKERVVLLYQGLYFVFNTVVIIGAAAYGGRWM